MTKKTIITAYIFAILGLVSLSAYTASAYQGDYTKKGPLYTPERHEAMENAFKTNNYTAWKNLMQGRGRATQVVNEQNFAKFAKAHELAEQGKYVEADALRKELGLRMHGGKPFGDGSGRVMGQGRMR